MDWFEGDISDAFSGIAAVRLGTYAPGTHGGLIARMAKTMEDNPGVGEVLLQLKDRVLEHYYHSLRVGLMFLDIAYHDAFLWDNLPKHTLSVVGIFHDLGKGETKVAEAVNYEGKLEGDLLIAMRSHNRLSKVRAAELSERFYPLLCDIAMRHHTYPRTGTERRTAERRAYDLIPDLGERSGNERRQYERRKVDPHIDRAGWYLSIVDMFDALSSRRAYKEPFAPKKIQEIIDTSLPGSAGVVTFLLKRYTLPE